MFKTKCGVCLTKLGVSAFVAKPFTMADLNAKIQRVVGTPEPEDLEMPSPGVPSGPEDHNRAVEKEDKQKRRERIRRRTQPTRYAARQYVFGNIEIFYNPNCKHTNNGMLSPVVYEET